ncbi:MAG: polysaccharide deacetylase family protein [Spirochaetes bacterium]|nr:polysaccharide deacetylase family protein [Spirochaetota bacterium]
MRGAELSILPISRAHVACAVLYGMAALLLPLHPLLAMLPLCLFLILCAAAPFIPRWGFFLPVVSRGPRHLRQVAVTFDDGPDPAVTPEVLSLLRRYDARATFFVAGASAAAHPELLREILRDGHSIGNHTYHHNPWLMTKPSAVIEREIDRSQELLAGLGVTTLAFRPPAAVTNPKLWRMLLRRGMFCVNFSNRALDGGNRRIAGLAGRILRRLTAGDIIMLHDCAPRDPAEIPYLLEQFEEVLKGIRERGLALVPLDRLIGREIMVPYGPEGMGDVVPLSQAWGAVAQSHLFRRAPGRFHPGVPGSRPGDDRILVLEAPAAPEGGTAPRNDSGIRRMIRCLLDASPGQYREIYIDSPLPAVTRDISSLLMHLRDCLAPGGRILCLSPAPSARGIAASLICSMRHGIILQLRGAGSLERAARRAGLRGCRVRIEEVTPLPFYRLDCTKGP